MQRSRWVFKNEQGEVLDITEYRRYEDFSEWVSDIEGYVAGHPGCEILLQHEPKERLWGLCSNHDTEGTVIWYIHLKSIPAWFKRYLNGCYATALKIPKAFMDRTFRGLEGAVDGV